MKKYFLKTLLLGILLFSFTNNIADAANFLSGEQLRTQIRLSEENNAITSTDDSKRFSALSEEYNINLSEADINAGKKNSHLKENGYYHMNANRETLISYAISKADWQPYRAYLYKESPAYFEIVDGKYEYSKIYYGRFLEKNRQSLNEAAMRVALGMIDRGQYEQLKSELEREFKVYVELFNNAKGTVPYIVHVNSNELTSKETGIPMVEKGFFDSYYNDPDVMAKGVFTKKAEWEKREAEKAKQEKNDPSVEAGGKSNQNKTTTEKALTTAPIEKYKNEQLTELQNKISELQNQLQKMISGE